MPSIVKKKSKNDELAIGKKPKQQTLKKKQKTESLNAAKKLTKSLKKKAISEKVQYIYTFIYFSKHVTNIFCIFVIFCS